MVSAVVMVVVMPVIRTVMAPAVMMLPVMGYIAAGFVCAVGVNVAIPVIPLGALPVHIGDIGFRAVETERLCARFDVGDCPIVAIAVATA